MSSFAEDAGSGPDMIRQAFLSSTHSMSGLRPNGLSGMPLTVVFRPRYEGSISQAIHNGSLLFENSAIDLVKSSNPFARA